MRGQRRTPWETGDVYVALSVSVDGFIAGPNETVDRPLGERGGERLHDWLWQGEARSTVNGSLAMAEPSRVVFDSCFGATTAMVSGRRTYDLVEGWHGSHPLTDVPIFVLTHRVPAQVPRGTTPFTFVTDGPEQAFSQAREAAGRGDIAVWGASAAQQALAAGLLDVIHLHVVPVLLGDGVRLFEHLGADAIDLAPLRVREAPGVTHLSYRVLR